MGLERVSILFELEQHIEIKLPDDTLAVSTVGELEIRVGAALSHHDGCRTARTFYRIRRALMEAGVPCRRVRPDTPVRDLIPPGSAGRRLWNRIRKHEPRVPVAELPPRIDAPLCLATGVACFIAIVAGPLVLRAVDVPTIPAVVASIACAVVGAAAIMHASNAFRPIPAGLHTIRDVVLAAQPKDVLDIIRMLIADECGVQLNEVHRTTDLARDLGI